MAVIFGASAWLAAARMSAGGAGGDALGGTGAPAGGLGSAACPSAGLSVGGISLCFARVFGVLNCGADSIFLTFVEAQ